MSIKKMKENKNEFMNFMLQQNEILTIALEECEKYYPKYKKRIIILWQEYAFRFVYDDKERRNRWFDYLWEFSNYIAKKYFPDEINEDWRRPCALEERCHKQVLIRLEDAWKQDPSFKNHLIEDLQTNPKIKDHPMTHLIEGLIAGDGLVSSDEVADRMNISHESMNIKINKMIKEKKLIPERDYYQSNLDDFLAA